VCDLPTQWRFGRLQLKFRVMFAYVGQHFPNLRQSILWPKQSLGLFAALLSMVSVFSRPDHNLPRGTQSAAAHDQDDQNTESDIIEKGHTQHPFPDTQT
jgi:hypothetical protein